MSKLPDTIPRDKYVPTPTSLQTSTELTNLSKQELALQKRIDKLDAVGLTDDKLFRKVLEGLDAGEEVEEVVDGVRSIKIKPNHVIQQKYTETALKMKNHLVPIEIKTEVNIDQRRNNINISKEDGERLLLIAKTLEALNARLEMGRGQSGEVKPSQPTDVIEASFKEVA